MGWTTKIKNEVRAVLLTTAYFAACFGLLLILKKILLAEYNIKFHHLSLALVGALVVGKVVLILEHVPLGGWMKRQPAWLDVIVRTALYAAGAFLVLLLEKSFESRHEYGGFFASLIHIFEHEDIHHVLAAGISVSLALLGFNVFAVLKRHLGQHYLIQLAKSPLPESRQEPNQAAG